jgi:putative transposase
MIGGLISVGRGWVMAVVSLSYEGFQYPGEIISPLRLVVSPLLAQFPRGREMMMQRGVVVTYEAIRQWYRKFGLAYANALRYRWLRPGDQTVGTRHEMIPIVGGAQRFRSALSTPPPPTAYQPTAKK